MIYLVGNVEQNICKIGTTVNLATRLSSIQTGCPYAIKVLYVIEGGAEKEKALHKKFAKYRLSGEWFKYADAILKHFQQFLNIYIPPAKKIKKADEKPFIYINRRFFQEVSLVGGQGKLLLFLAEKMTKANTVKITADLIAEYIKAVPEVNNKSTFYKQRNLLIDQGMLTKARFGLIKVNEKYFRR